LLLLQEKIACKFADQVITVTELWRQTLIGRGVPAHKVAVVMNVADNRIFKQARLPVTGGGGSYPAPANGLAPTHQTGEFINQELSHPFNLIYHGTLAARYGVDLLLAAVRELTGRIPGIQLTIHGRGEYLDELVRLAEQLGVEDQVTFSTRYMPIEDLPAFLQQGDLGVVPYRRNIFTDGILPTKMMEYVALGIPVVAARTPVIEHYFDESMVHFFEPDNAQDLADCIYELYQDRPRLQALASSASRFLETHTWEQVSASYAGMVRKLNREAQPAVS
jgi:glycosyltransferase involved in cell wall biosynthesis